MHIIEFININNNSLKIEFRTNLEKSVIVNFDGKEEMRRVYRPNEYAFMNQLKWHIEHSEYWKMV